MQDSPLFADKTDLMRFVTLAIVLTLSFAATSLAGQQPDPRWQASLSTFVSEGEYGTPDTTRLVYTTLSMRRSFPRGDLTVRIPKLNVTTDGTVLVFRGVPQTATGTRQTPAPTRGVVAPIAVQETQTTRASGIGDVTVGGRIFLVEDSGRRPAIDVIARVDLPTGDDSRGLGLGTASAQIGVDVQKSIGAHVIALSSASFTATGRVDDVSLQNPWEYSAGLGVYLTRAVLITGSYEQWRPVVPGTASGRDLLATATVGAGRHLRVLISAQVPLSEQASDFGAGAGLAVRF